jgi:hypothetical protein
MFKITTLTLDTRHDTSIHVLSTSNHLKIIIYMRCHYSKLDTAMCLVFPHFAHMLCLSLDPTNNNVGGRGLESGVASGLDHHEQAINLM